MQPMLVLDYLPLAGAARLVRVWGGAPCITLPEAVPAPAGGTLLPLAGLEAYCFAETQRSKAAPAALCRCALGPGGQARLLPASAAPSAPPAPPTDETGAPLPLLCGALLEQVTLPASLRAVGNCAFYNCRKLHTLSFGPGELALGSDIFLNCFALAGLRMRAGPGAPTSLGGLVSRYSGHLRAVFAPQEAQQPAAALWFPEYWEDYEETPAHILLHSFSGQGYHYRQCFANRQVAWAEYDAVFAQGHTGDDAGVMALLCLDRLRYPYQLSPAARAAYRAFLGQNSALAVQRLLRSEDLDALRALLALGVMDAAALAQAGALARRANNAAAAALLADAQRAAQPAARTGRYSFDFDEL